MKMYIDKAKKFLTSISRSVAILFFSLFGLMLVVFAYSSFKDYQDKKEAEVYKVVKDWEIDMSQVLKMQFNLKTRHINGHLEAIIDVAGYPDYLTVSGGWDKNRNNSLYFVFKDKDGFEIARKEVGLQEFTRVSDGKGGWIGLRTQATTYMSLDSYKSLSAIVIEWTLNTTVEKKVEQDKSKSLGDASSSDHCAPGLSRRENQAIGLKRYS